MPHTQPLQDVYRERAGLIAALANHHTSWLVIDPAETETAVVWIRGPIGPSRWVISRRDVGMFLKLRIIPPTDPAAAFTIPDHAENLRRLRACHQCATDRETNLAALLAEVIGSISTGKVLPATVQGWAERLEELTP